MAAAYRARPNRLPLPGFRAAGYANLGAVLDALGARPEHVVDLTVFVADHDMPKLGVLTQQVTSMFGATLPAQTLVPVPKLAVDGMLYGLEAIATLDQD